MKQLDKYLATPAQLAPLRESGRGKNVPLEVLIFLGVTALAMAAQVVILLVLSMSAGVALVLSGGSLDSLPAWLPQALSLFSTAGMVVIVLVLLRFAFRRPLSTAGLRRPFLKEYLLGLLAGLAVFSLAVLLCMVTGALTFQGLSPTFHPGLLVLFFLASSAPRSASLMTGGAFGLEGGLAVTVVLVLSIAFVTWRNYKRTAPGRAAAPEETAR